MSTLLTMNFWRSHKVGTFPHCCSPQWSWSSDSKHQVSDSIHPPSSSHVVHVNIRLVHILVWTLDTLLKMVFICPDIALHLQACHLLKYSGPSWIFLKYNSRLILSELSIVCLIYSRVNYVLKWLLNHIYPVLETCRTWLSHKVILINQDAGSQGEGEMHLS